MTTLCRVCHSDRCEPWMDFGRQPNSVRLLATADESEPTHPLQLGHCPCCGFLFLLDPLPAEAFYNDAQMPTSLFPARHLPELVSSLNQRKTKKADPVVFEIGCNDGYFLSLLRRAGFTSLHGIEPSMACAAQARSAGLDIETGYFSAEKAKTLREAGLQADIVICRHVLEHILDVDDFFSGLTTLLAPDGLVVLEVPDLHAIAMAGDFSAIWEQHVNYFDLPVLTRLVARFGLNATRAQHLPHGGGTLLTFLEPGPAAASVPTAPERDGMAILLHQHLALLKDTVTQLYREGKRIVGFGAGMRGTMLINLSGIGSMMESVLDDNPVKVGRFLPGSRLPIRPTSLLLEDPPDLCILLPLNAKSSEETVMARFSKFQLDGGQFLEFHPAEGGFLRLRP